MKNYDEELLLALQTKQDSLSKEAVANLKDNLINLHETFRNIYNIFLNKNVIRAYEYNDEARLSTLTLPSKEVFSDGQRVSELSLRLAELNQLYDYAAHSFKISAEALTLVQLKRLTGLLRYIEWQQFGVSSENYMTDCLSLLTKETRSDGVSEKMLMGLGKKMTMATRGAIEAIRDFTSYQKELYKHTLRTTYFAGLSFDSTLPYAKGEDKFINGLRKVMVGGKLPFYRELVVEACAEIYGDKAEELQNNVLQALQNLPAGDKPEAKAPTKKKEAAAKNPKDSIIAAFFELGRLAFLFDSVIKKLEQNNLGYTKYGLSFGQKFALWLRRFAAGSPAVVYKTAFVDPASGSTHRKEIDFDKFIDKLENRLKFFTSFANSNPQVNKKLNDMADEDLDKLLSKHITESREITTDLLALDNFFKENLAANKKLSVKGIKIEVNNIKQVISRVVEFRHEYISAKELLAAKPAL
ncbi:MAG: hypothetical protein FWE37_08325 [Spirochaetaceae bacterium]|nr:hypothetical protein [Spirochaetaceae bacterium]